MLHIMKKFLEFKFSDEKQSCFNLDFMTFFFENLWFCKEVSTLTAKVFIYKSRDEPFLLNIIWETWAGFGPGASTKNGPN